MISLILPFHSDVHRLIRTLEILRHHSEKYSIAEVLLCHNGSPLSQENEILLRQSMIPISKLLHVDQKGIGAGYKLGIKNATQPICLLSASDLPFGFSDIESFMSLNKPRFAIGSKAHKNSRISGYGLSRRTASVGFWLFRAAFLSLQTPKDTQGTLFIETEMAKKLLSQCQYNDYFFSVEIITLAQQQGIKPVEIPVVLENHDGESSVSVVKDSWRLAKDLFEFSARIKRRDK